MFCRNCAREVPDQTEFCMGCGARPLAGKAYCNVCGTPTTPLTELCIKCGARISTGAVSVNQAADMGVKVTDSYPSSPKSRTVMAVLAWFTGYVGVHRFYAGRIPSGVAMAIVWVLGMCIYVPGIIFSMADDVFGRTTGFAAIETAARTSPVWFGVLLIIVGGLMVTGMEIWRLVDFVMVLLGRFRDGDGLPITRWLNNNTSSGVAAGGQVMTSSPASSPKSRLVTVLLAAFVGWLGIHCFYVGRTGRGVAMLILGIIILPVSSVWALVDLVFAITGQFRDRNNMLITDWQV